jgi:hypothetical protein
LCRFDELRLLSCREVFVALVSFHRGAPQLVNHPARSPTVPERWSAGQWELIGENSAVFGALGLNNSVGV